MRTLRAYLAVPMIFRGALLLLVSVAALIFVQVQWRGPALAASTAETASFERLRAEVSQLKARIDSVANHDQMEQRITSVAARFEAEVDRSGVVERLSALSSASGTRIIHGSSTFGRPRGEVIPVEQDLTIEGPYVALARFFAGLERMETLTLLRSADIAANPDGTLVRAKVKLITLSAGTQG